MKKTYIRINETRMNGLQNLAIAFTALKLGGVINWEWWWITAPVWVPVVLIVAANFALEKIYNLAGK